MISRRKILTTALIAFFIIFTGGCRNTSDEMVQHNVADSYNLTEEYAEDQYEYVRSPISAPELVQTEEYSDEPITIVTVSNENDLRLAVMNAESRPKKIKLTQNIELISNFVIPADANITITSDSTTMFSIISTRDMDVITISENASLLIENLEITRVSGTFGRGIDVERDATFIMINSVISGNAIRDGNGGGVRNSGTFILYSGTIRNNLTYVARENQIRGGGVFNTGTFTMNNGIIDNNLASLGGGGVGNHGTFIMNDGIISNNTTRADLGGGVFNSGTFTMNEGVIKGNSVIGGISVVGATGGGGVNNSRHFTMNGGIISDNSTASRGGGVNISGGGGTLVHR